MPAFTALNVEPEESITEEFDNTRELQVEEALKRFQTALKLHAQGPRHYDEASAAYESLFDSDIFRFPESVTDFDRAESQTHLTQQPLDVSFAQALEAAQADADGIAGSLPQTLYLAYKNHGQFELDGIRHQAKVSTLEGREALFRQPKTLEKARKALSDFSEALDRDPSDAELWRRASRVAAFLQSARTSRYCLEAAIELDDDPAVDEVEPPSLAEGFAGEQLKRHLKALEDEVALSHPIMGPFVKKSLPAQLQKYVDPAPFLPDRTSSLAVLVQSSAPEVDEPVHRVLEVSEPSWSALGMALVHCLSANGMSSQPVSISMPEVPETVNSSEQSIITAEPNTAITAAATNGTPVVSAGEDQVQGTLPEDAAESPIESKGDAKLERGSSALSRKRSQSMAGLVDGDNEEIAEKRSKRTRRRDTAHEEPVDTQTGYALRLEQYQAADKHLFELTSQLLEKAHVTDPGTKARLAEMIDLSAVENRTANVVRLSMVDLRDSLIKFEEDTARILLEKKEESPIGFATFLEHSKPSAQHKFDTPALSETDGLHSFVETVNKGWLGVPDIAFEWLSIAARSYTHQKWSEKMKTAVVQVISRLDEDLYRRITYEVEKIQPADEGNGSMQHLDETIQMLFELHLDVYERITNPNSAVDFGVRAETKVRLGRWFSFAATMSRTRPVAARSELSIRFLWATVFFVTLWDGVSREHVLQCWQSLRDALVNEYNGTDLRLPNNAILVEISTVAADKEISKLTTMDFFLGLFQDDMSEPVSVIESLEPVLNPSSVYNSRELPSTPPESPTPSMQLRSVSPDSQGKPIAETASQGLRDLWKFLMSASTELRLFLWTRLGDAYAAINYKTKQFACQLKGIEMIVADFERDPYISMSVDDRRGLLVKMLKFLDELLVKALGTALNDSEAFEIIDDQHLKTSIAALTKLGCLLHTTAMFEDEVRVGMTTARTSNNTFTSYLNKLRDLQARNWSLLFVLLKTSLLQDGAALNTPELDLADYLVAAHQGLGLRKACKASNKIFLKMMRAELLKQKLIENWEDYLGQVLYDLYGLKLGVGDWEAEDHACPPEKLERKNTLALVERVSVLANRMPMKDLLKSDLKNTIEHMQQAIGQTKSNQQMIHNLRNFTEYLRRPIHPLRLYQALKGNVTIDAVAVNTPDSSIARHGWFFLLGMIAFSKFKGVDLNRRQTPGATDDLRIGATFLRQQLQFTPDQWESWFRLAECFDYELDEAVLWTADKMNKDRAELVKYQRSAIHCYTLALSHSWKAFRDADGEVPEAIHELYHKFGMRMYASSREPFKMEPFQHADQERFFIKTEGSGTFKKVMHEQMTDFKIWKYAAGLFRRAMSVKPKEWKNSYMLAKCMWKMYQKSPADLDKFDRDHRPTVQDVIKALENSVAVVSGLRRPRSGTDPILEPHYKIVSIIYKLVTRGDISAQEGADILQRQPFAIRRGEKVEMDEVDEWETFIISTLTCLKEKDKSNWQHRISMRHARILFNDSEGPEPSRDQQLQAMAAFQILQKSMFTKTMVMNVWKCDAERPGRHHVYTEQYVRYMVHVLTALKDRVNFESLLRRMRKKGADFYNFNELWQSSCVAYVRLLRRFGSVEPIMDDAYKNVSPDSFDGFAERISQWGVDKTEHAAFATMRDAVELKKLNGGLMKAGPIDDLISDAYTAIYVELRKEASESSLRAGLGEQKAPSGMSIDPSEAPRTATVDAMLIDSEAPDTKPNPFRDLLNPQTAENSGTETGAATPSREAGEGAAAKPTRRLGVRRADILRKAEQAVLRALEGPAKPAPGGKSVRGSVSSGKRGSRSASVDDQPNVNMKDSDDEAASAPSVHDSADDESDLSDLSSVPDQDLLDEDEAARLMYPDGQDSQHEDDNEEEEEDEDEERVMEQEVDGHEKQEIEHGDEEGGDQDEHSIEAEDEDEDEDMAEQDATEEVQDDELDHDGGGGATQASGHEIEEEEVVDGDADEDEDDDDDDDGEQAEEVEEEEDEDEDEEEEDEDEEDEHQHVRNVVELGRPSSKQE